MKAVPRLNAYAVLGEKLRSSFSCVIAARSKRQAMVAATLVHRADGYAITVKPFHATTRALDAAKVIDRCLARDTLGLLVDESVRVPVVDGVVVARQARKEAARA